MIVTVLHAGAKHSISLDEMNVQSLMEKIMEITDVPLSSQKLIFNGKSLIASQTFEEAKVKDGSKIMLIGKKGPNMEEEKVLTSIRSVAKKTDKSDKRLETVINDFKSLQGGFLTSQIELETVDKIRNQHVILTEELVRQMEELDQLDIETNFSDARLQRKRLIHRIQGVLTQVDTLGEKLEEYNKAQKYP